MSTDQNIRDNAVSTVRSITSVGVVSSITYTDINGNSVTDLYPYGRGFIPTPSAPTPTAPIPTPVVAPSGTVLPTLAKGETLKGDGTGKVIRLPLGSQGQVLSSLNGDAVWVTPATPTTTATPTPNLITAQGDLVTGGVNNAPARLPKGAEGQVLTVVAGDLRWQAPALAAPSTTTTTNPTTPVSYTITTLPAASTANRGTIVHIAGSGLSVGIDATAGAVIYSDGLKWRYVMTGTILGDPINTPNMPKLREGALSYTAKVDPQGRATEILYKFTTGADILDRYLYANGTDLDPIEALLNTTATTPFNTVVTGVTGATTVATGYSVTTASSILELAVPVTYSVVATGGNFSAGTTITPTVTGVTGTFNPTSLTGAGTFTFTATSKGTGNITTTNNRSLPATSNGIVVNSSKLAFTQFTSDTFETNGVLTFYNVDNAMAIAKLPVDFKELRVLTTPRMFDRNILIYLSGASEPSRVFTDPSGSAGVGVGIFDGVLGLAPPSRGALSTRLTLPANSILSMRKAANGDLVYALASDGVAFADVYTQAGVFPANNPDRFLHVIKCSNIDRNGIVRPPGDTVEVQISNV